MSYIDPRLFSRALSLIPMVGLLGLSLALWECDSSTATEATEPNAEIAILSPIPGESYQVGSELPIKWRAVGKGLDEVNAVNIELSPDSGKTWLGLLDKSIGTGDPAWGVYPWPIPADIRIAGVARALSGNTKVRIRISQYSTSDPNKIVVSPKTFSIVR